MLEQPMAPFANWVPQQQHLTNTLHQMAVGSNSLSAPIRVLLALQQHQLQLLILLVVQVFQQALAVGVVVGAVLMPLLVQRDQRFRDQRLI